MVIYTYYFVKTSYNCHFLICIIYFCSILSCICEYTYLDRNNYMFLYTHTYTDFIRQL